MISNQISSRMRKGLAHNAVRLMLLAGATAPVMLPGMMMAQAVNGSLLGTVQDKTGAAVPNAKVTITEKATNITHEATTNANGNYSFQNLSQGAYSVNVQMQGFQSETHPSVDVLVNNTTRSDFDLNPGNVTETIEVTDTAPMMQSDRADVSTKIEQQSVESLPMGVNRNFQSLLNLVPGTTPATFQHSQFFNAGSTLQTEVNGLPRMGNAYNIEGIDDDMRTGLLQILIPPADAIGSVEASTNNFQVELGRAIGAVTNVTLKSGSNRFHGSASEYLQNSFFNARSYFAASAGKVTYNYFGGNISGPIIKDKLFFYGDYFRTADHERTSNTLTIPFPKYYTDNGSGFIDLSDLPTQVYDPATGDPVTGAGRTPFAGNKIPIGRVNAVSLGLLQKLPKPNQNLNTLAAPSNNYFVNSPFYKDAHTYDAKIDYQITPKDHLSGRFSQQIYSLFQAPSFSSFLGGPGNGGGFAGTGHQNAFSTGLNYDHAFSSTLLTEVRLGVAHYRNTSQPADYGSNDATTAGAPGVNVDQLTSGQLGINIGTFSSGPFIGYSPSMPWIRAEANIDFVNNWTKIVGNHTFRWGVDIRRVRDGLLQGQTYSPRGVTTFGQNQTSIPGGKTGAANDIASMLLDVPSGVGRDLFTYFPDFRQWWYFGFAGDKWQVNNKLTLDLGVRWEYYQPATPAKTGGFSQYDPGTNQLRIAGVGANPMDLGYKKQLNYWAPRTGFAYRVSDNTVVRGGIGMAYMPYADNTWLYNYPVRANNAYTSCGSGSSYLAAQYTCSGNTNSQPVTFQSGFPAPVPVVVPTSGIYQIDPSNSLLNNQTYIYIPQDYHNPYVYSYNFAVQQALPANFSLSIAYVGNHGVRIGAANNINLPDRLNCGTACQPLQIKFQHSAGVTQQFIGFSSNYSSLQTTLSRRFTNGLSSNSSYTWGKGLGYQQGDDGAITFFQDLRRNYARNDFDRTNSFSQSVTYELPLGKGKKWVNTGFLSQAIGGWKLSGIVLLYSGTPFNVTANGGTINTSGWQQNANIVAPFKKLKGIGNNAYWFDPTSFAQPNGCTGYATATPTTVTCPIINGVTVGNTGRNAFTGPGLFQNNASIFKTFGLPMEGTTLDVRMDVFQLTNTPQFSNPSNSITSATFGRVTGTTGSGSGVNGTGGGRSLQLAAIFKF
ncbi:carboxypeptidase regulatory-like domain-containing protein [Terriglobus roseus]|uniref:Carboxypeptidase regulatory-like domain-containing protein n=1 Tax=Terriglobus roseus TaxID=392734 RepID=A0A1G7P1V6_9BACT|nr:carboxypeptidase regulatory-like domain-containing protein [Terriglobus roseus]SDF80243.1 Carboxypeptidase regulatory-like domain-containing protein [Terriglobus roseus]